MSRRFEHYTDAALETRERRSLAAVEAEIRILREIVLERVARRSVKMNTEPAVPQSGAAGRQ